MPARKGGEQQEGQERQHDSHDDEVGEDDRVFERLCHPDKIQRILVHGDQVRQGSGVVIAEEGTAAALDADAKVTDPHQQVGVADNVGYGGGDSRLYLRRAEDRRVVLVVEGYEIYVGDEWRGRGAAC